MIAKTKWLRLIGLLGILLGSLPASPAAAQVEDADCFGGSCGGSKGIPECPRGYDTVGLVLYANSKADAQMSCETVVSCTNLGRRDIEINCRFYHGFNPVPAGGMGLLWGPQSPGTPVFDPPVIFGLIPGVEYKALIKGGNAAGNL